MKTKCFQIFIVVCVAVLAQSPSVVQAENGARGMYSGVSDAGIVGSVDVRDQFKVRRDAAPAPMAQPVQAVAPVTQQPAPQPQTPVAAAVQAPAKQNNLADRVIDASSAVSPAVLSKLSIPHSLEQPKIAEEAPDSFKCMALANQQGDKATAQHCADKYVMYMANLMFQVRELSQMIGESLVRLGIVKEDDWVGAEQYMNRELALARQEESTPFQATNEMALKRITPDANQQAEVYFFCTLTNNFCREMAPNVERLWQMFKKDPSVKLATVLIAESRPEFINSFREYTGLTSEIYVGPELAKKLRIGFVPAVVVRSPTSGHIYTKTGFQSFERMYQFVRAVQGRSIDITAAVQQLAARPIGFEKGAKGFDWSKVEKESHLLTAAGKSAEPHKVGKF